ncbi:hypothetical protein AVEN_5579-1 [Araneus ventricosus]|uniref:RNase H type-1 domain-containing protein n=1 Tax=Araneus ventricosus TaxID=182803 RepID=A0A4Y2UTF7_ARAVE|nr:hypothetical protein AVEN_4071-1 [Araneus ventricosus]GBO15461.1 hypothetical protein AVEN_5579-1 [Araneus ventricosus]
MRVKNMMILLFKFVTLTSLIYKQGIVPFICYGSQIWGTALKKKINCRLLRKKQRRIVLRVISGYRTISYEAVFAISGFPPIDISIVHNRDFKIATKTCVASNQDVCLPVSKMPHPSERSPINLVGYYENIEDNIPVVCFTDGSKINSKVGLAFVVFQDHIETEVHQFRIRDECSVFQAELLCIAQAVNWIRTNENLSSNFLICSDSLSSLYALNCITSPNRLIVKTQTNLNFLQGRDVQVFFSFVRGHIGIYGNERADWLAKEVTKLIDFIPMTVPKSFYKSVFKKHVISQWNNLYQISHNAKSNKEFFPSIHGRLKAIHFVPNFRITQFLTGHGNFKAYLKRFNLSRTDLCSCSSGEIQDVNHLILSCSKLTPARCLLISTLKKNNFAWPPSFSTLVQNKTCFASFSEFIDSIFPHII